MNMLQDLEYIKKMFYSDFEKMPSFCNELFKKIYNKIILEKKDEHLKRLILYNTFKLLSGYMITDVKSIKFYKNNDNLIIEFDAFSLSSGIKTYTKILYLDLAF